MGRPPHCRQVRQFRKRRVPADHALKGDHQSLEVAAFVSHGLLSPEERRLAEEAFAGRDDCVIVATSVLAVLGLPPPREHGLIDSR